MRHHLCACLVALACVACTDGPPSVGPAGAKNAGSGGAGQGGMAQGGAAQGGMAQGSAAQGGAAQGGMAQGGAAQGGAAQGGAAQGGAAQGGAAQGGMAQGGAAQGGAAQGGAGQGGGVLGAGSIAFYENQNGAGDDYAQIVDLPPTFGSGAFTFEIWVLLDDSLPTGLTAGGSTANWSDSDPQPPPGWPASSWWFNGNFLLDGHNNDGAFEGTFDLQIIGEGRVRWLFGDGSALYGVQAWPSSTVPTLLDGTWHQISTVRRFVAPNSADLELWVDGVLTNRITGVDRVNMRTYWDTWSSFPFDQPGWFFGAEKISATGGNYWDDYKGLIEEMRFWDVARSVAELQSYTDAVNGSESGLVGWYRLDEGTGPDACDAQNGGGCITLMPTGNAIWSSQTPPLLP